MPLSSQSYGSLCGLVARSVTDHCLQNVGSAPRSARVALATRPSPTLPTTVPDSYQKGQENLTSSLGELGSPQAKLHGLVRAWVGRRDAVAEYGCPFGSLASELGKVSTGGDSATAMVMTDLLAWAEEQFRSMGRTDARDLAVALSLFFIYQDLPMAGPRTKVGVFGGVRKTEHGDRDASSL
jgi:hypothetical protein